MSGKSVHITNEEMMFIAEQASNVRSVDRGFNNRMFRLCEKMKRNYKSKYGSLKVKNEL